MSAVSLLQSKEYKSAKNYNSSTVLFESLASQSSAMFICFLQQKNRKRLPPDVMPKRALFPTVAL